MSQYIHPDVEYNQKMVPEDNKINLVSNNWNLLWLFILGSDGIFARVNVRKVLSVQFWKINRAVMAGMEIT